MRQTSLHRSAPFFDAAQDLFEGACARAGREERYVLVGDRNCRLVFAGPAMVPKILPSLQHLEVPPEPSQFEIQIWDTESTGIKMPPPPWEQGQMSAKGEIIGFNDERYFAAYQMGPDALTLWDQDSQRGIFWVRNAAQVPWYESGSPLRYLFHLFHSTQNAQMVHGAAVGFPEAAVLITGKGGMGKSTTALSCLFSNLSYLGDDYVLVDSETSPCAFSLYNSAKLTENSLNYYPEFGPHIANPARSSEEKSILFLQRSFPEKLMRKAPLKAVLIPRIGPNPKPRLESVSPIEGLKALAPSTLVQLPRARAALFHRLGDLVKKIPTFILHLSPNPRETPALLERHLKNLD